MKLKGSEFINFQQHEKKNKEWYKEPDENWKENEVWSRIEIKEYGGEIQKGWQKERGEVMQMVDYHQNHTICVRWKACFDDFLLNVRETKQDFNVRLGSGSKFD